MKIGINAVNQPQGGSLANLRQLFGEWKRAGLLGSDQIVIFASTTASKRLGDSIPQESLVVRVPIADRGLPGRLFAEQIELPRLLRSHGIDVLFCPGNTMPIRSAVPCVTTFQNAAPYCNVRNAPRSLRFRWLVLGSLMRQSARRSRRVIFLSRFFLDLFVNRFGFDPRRGVLIYRSGFLSRSQSQAPSRNKEILSVSHFYPYKNILELVEGFVAARRGRKAPWVLLLAGGEFVGDYGDRIRGRLRALNAGEDEVRILGDLAPAEIEKLLQRCGIFAFSSVCENCPTALIEALHVGAPIACSNVGVMPEIAGDAAEYFDPYSPRDIERALGKLMDDPARRYQLASAALLRSPLFPDPAKAAAATLEVIRSAAV